MHTLIRAYSGMHTYNKVHGVSVGVFSGECVHVLCTSVVCMLLGSLVNAHMLSCSMSV